MLPSLLAGHFQPLCELNGRLAWLRILLLFLSTIHLAVLPLDLEPSLPCSVYSLLLVFLYGL